MSRYEQQGYAPRVLPKPSVSAGGPRLFGAAEWMMTAVFVMELLTLPAVTPGPNAIGAVSIGLCLGLPSMLAVWSAVRSGVGRYVLTVVLSLLNGIILTWAANPRFDLMLMLLPLASALPTLVTLWVIKRVFGRFAPLESQTQVFLEGLRFRLSHLFIVTTVLAVLLAIGKAFWPFLEVNGPPGFFVTLGSLVVLFSFTTLIFVWALMGRRAILRACIVVPVALVSLMICTWICNPSNDSAPIVWYIITGLPLVSSFLLLAVLRHQGWRFWKAVK